MDTDLILGPRRGWFITMEGVWGAGKTTNARRLAAHLSEQGFRATVLHDGVHDGVISELSTVLDKQPLRSREGDGGYEQPHHATVDVLLRQCREAYQHRELYAPMLASHDVVISDRGALSKLAYAITVLLEQHPHATQETLLERLHAISSPWWLAPDRAFFLDQPWQQARQRAIARNRGDQCQSSSRERLLFLPHYDAAYRFVVDSSPKRTMRVPVGQRGPDEVFTDIAASTAELLRVPTTARTSS